MPLAFVNDISDVATLISTFLLIGIYIRNRATFTTWKSKGVGVILLLGSIHRQFAKMIFDVPINSSTPGFVLVVSAMIVGIPLLVLAVVIFLHDFGIDEAKLPILFYEKAIAALVILNVITFVYGAVNGNPVRYVASDTYKIFIFAGSYYIGRSIFLTRKYNYKGWTNFIFEVFTVMFIRTAIIQLYSLIRGDLIAVVSFTYAPFVLFAFLLVDYFDVTGKSQVYWSAKTKLLVGLGSLGSAVLLLSRATWLILIGMFIVFLMTNGNQLVKTRRRVGTLVASPVIGVIGLVVFQGVSKRATALVDALISELRSLSEIGRPGWRAKGSLDQKIAEALDVIYHYTEYGTIFNYVFGFGNGARYLAIHGKATSLDALDRTYRVLNHNIHNLLFAQFFRRGLLGVMFTLVIFGGLMRVFFSVWRGSYRGIHTTVAGTAFFVTMAVFVSDMSAASAFQNSPFGIYLGLMAGIIINQYTTGYENDDENPNRKGVDS